MTGTAARGRTGDGAAGRVLRALVSSADARRRGRELGAPGGHIWLDHRSLAMSLVEQTGLEAVDAGVPADSWRQQPGAPVYCTDRTAEEMPALLAAAEKDRVPQRRDLAMTSISEYVRDGGTVDGTFLVALDRACYA